MKNTPSPADANEDIGAPKEWYSRGYLPHRDAKQLLQAVTFRLADSLPQEKLTLLEEELSNLPENQRSTLRREKIEQWLDAGMGCCALRHPKLAEQMRDTLLHFDGQRYQLLAWCIMPNHVHVLMETLTPIARIIQGWKSVTARWALAHNEELQLGIPNPKHLWMRDYWDRYIRNDRHFENTILYIHENPVKAGLCQRAEDWPWSSAGTPRSSSASTPHSANEDVGAPIPRKNFRNLESAKSVDENSPMKPAITTGEILLEDYFVPMGISQNPLARELGISPEASKKSCPDQLPQNVWICGTDVFHYQ